MENAGKRIGTTDASITNRIQELRERIAGEEDTIEKIDTVKENVKAKRIPDTSQPGNLGYMKRPNLRIKGRRR